MMAARLKQCLAVLRWRDIDLADASGRAISDVRAWLDGRQRPPLSVAAWLEALVKAHHSVPPLRSAMSISEKPFRAGDAFEIEAETARGMFFAFAQRNDLLAPRLDEVVAAETVGAFGASASN